MVLALLSTKRMIYTINSKKRLETILEAKRKRYKKYLVYKTNKHKRRSIRNAPWLNLSLTKLYHNQKERPWVPKKN